MKKKKRKSFIDCSFWDFRVYNLFTIFYLTFFEKYGIMGISAPCVRRGAAEKPSLFIKRGLFICL